MGRGAYYVPAIFERTARIIVSAPLMRDTLAECAGTTGSRGAEMRDLRLLMAGVLTLAVGAAGAGCRRESGPPSAPPSASPAATPAASGEYANGFTAEDRRQFYHLSEGGELYPVDWLVALEATVTDANGRTETRPFLET